MSMNTGNFLKAAVIVLFLLAFFIHGCTESPAVRVPTLDGSIVLTKKGRALGAFIPRNQRMSPETLEYEWYYRTDGKGTFGPHESGMFKRGKGRLSKTDLPSRPYKAIEFGPFSIGWSGHEDGKGWIYYDHFGGEAISPDDQRICVTLETDIKRIDAADLKWVYKGSPTDRGVRANGQKLSEVR